MEYNLSQFRWYPSERLLRAVMEDLRMSAVEGRLTIKGKRATIVFEYKRSAYDHTLQRYAYLYLPYAETTPSKYRDITLHMFTSIGSTGIDLP